MFHVLEGLDSLAGNFDSAFDVCPSSFGLRRFQSCHGSLSPDDLERPCILREYVMASASVLLGPATQMIFELEYWAGGQEVLAKFASEEHFLGPWHVSSFCSVPNPTLR